MSMAMRQSTMSAATLLLGACLLTACAHHQSRDRLSSDVLFGPRFQSGRVAIYRFVSDGTSTQKSEDIGGAATDHTEITMRLTINHVAPDGSADGSLRYDRIVVRGEPSVGAKYAFDSDAPQPDPQTDPQVTAAFRLLANATVHFHADASGRIDPADVSGTEDACAAMQQLDALRDRGNQFNRDGAANLLESTWRIGEEAFARNIDHPWVELGERPFEGETFWYYNHTFTPVEQTPERVVIDVHMDMHL